MAGLFLFRKNETENLNIAEMKPSQLDLSKGNSLKNIPKTQTTSPNPSYETPEAIPTKARNLAASDEPKWAVFENILKTKNDNDPRMDRVLKNLSAEFHEALYEKYELLAPEDRNGKGLIIFLISRDLRSIEDFQFLKKIYQESPCLSLADCKTLAPESPHHSSTDQTTLIYGQLTALYAIDKQLSENPSLLNDAAKRSGFSQVLAQAETFAVPVIQEKARGLRTKYGL